MICLDKFIVNFIVMKTIATLFVLFLGVNSNLFAQKEYENLMLSKYRISFDFGLHCKHFFTMNTCEKKSISPKTPTPPSSGIPTPLDYVDRICKNSTNCHFEFLFHNELKQKFIFSSGLAYYNRTNSNIYDIDSVQKYTLLSQYPVYTFENSYYEHYSFSNSIVLPISFGYIWKRFIFNMSINTTVFSFPYHIYWFLNGEKKEFFEKNKSLKIKIYPSIQFQYVLNYKKTPVLLYLGADSYDLQFGIKISFINFKKKPNE